MSMVKNALLRIGLIRLKIDGSIRWPVRVDGWMWWRLYLRLFFRGEWFCSRDGKGNFRTGFPFGCPYAAFGVFRNLPGVTKWEPGRLLPRRWGVQIFGLEIGDRG
jgi:hypothetical protein